MMLNIKNVLTSKGISSRSFAEFLNVSEKTAYNKLMGLTDFTYPEAEKIMEAVEKLTLCGGYDLNDDIAAMLAAMLIVVDKLIPNITKDMDLVGFATCVTRPNGITCRYCARGARPMRRR